MIEKSKNLVSPSVTLLKEGTHVERAGSVLYVLKCAKMVATITKLRFSTGGVSLLVDGQNQNLSIRYINPITKICIIIVQPLLATRCTQKCQIRRLQFSTIWRNAEEIQL